MECMVAILICVGSMLLLSGAAYVHGRAEGYRKGRYDLDVGFGLRNQTLVPPEALHPQLRR